MLLPFLTALREAREPVSMGVWFRLVEAVPGGVPRTWRDDKFPVRPAESTEANREWTARRHRDLIPLASWDSK